jgi:hypothetical protein
VVRGPWSVVRGPWSVVRALIRGPLPHPVAAAAPCRAAAGPGRCRAAAGPLPHPVGPQPPVVRGPWSVGPLVQYRVSFRGSERLLTHKIPRDAARARGHVLGPNMYVTRSEVLHGSIDQMSKADVEKALNEVKKQLGQESTEKVIEGEVLDTRSDVLETVEERLLGLTSKH